VYRCIVFAVVIHLRRVRVVRPSYVVCWVGDLRKLCIIMRFVPYFLCHNRIASTININREKPL
jgi:hypothetical protein